MVVREVRQEAEHVVSFALARRDGQPLPEWEPGAHVDVLIAGDLVRQYSLCSTPSEPTWRIAVLREQNSRGGSTWLHDRVREGDIILVAAPRNNFSLDLSGERFLFVAGGIGITPLLPMVAAAESAGKDWSLLYLGISGRSMAFTEALRAYTPKVVLHRDADSGVIDLEATLDRLGAPGATIYACGPAGLLAAVESYAGRRENCCVVLERFTADPDSVAVPQGDHAFVVETSDGREVKVGADESILDALHRSGIPALSSCREGICGTCETRVVQGIPDHRDQLLSEEERQSGEVMMICVSRCLGDRLVLDV
ncbi:PDR/VanB family oxidoreductase [Blastococcus mobilis]|nr:PDR/VanB family oxidoreductase [Blastococcus mobilis]